MPELLVPVTLIVTIDNGHGTRHDVALDASHERTNLAPGGERSVTHQYWQLHPDHRGPTRAAIFVNPMLKKNELGERFFAGRRLDFDCQLQILRRADQSRVSVQAFTESVGTISPCLDSRRALTTVLGRA